MTRPRAHPATVSFLLAAVLVALRPGPAPFAEEGGFEAGWKARTERLVTDLQALAARAQKSKLFGSRDTICERILRFAPDHEQARKWLKYKRSADGAWVRKGRYRRPRNLGRAGFKALQAQDEAVCSAFAADALALLRAHAATVPDDVRARTVRDVLVVAPEDAGARIANGERRTAEDGWLLEETVQATARRRGLSVAAQHALDEVKAPRDARPTRLENGLRIGWTAILDGSRARVVGTVPADELSRAHRACEACFGLFRRAFDEEPPRINGLTVYMLQTAAERDTLLANHPNATDAYRKKSGRRSSSWFPKTNMTWIMTSKAARLEWCTRQPFASLLRRHFGITAQHGWAFEGFGLYLSHLLTGTRGTFFVRPTAYGGGDEPKAGALWERLRAAGADWRAEARALPPSVPDLRLMLGKGTNTMTMEELLFAYALAAYVLEGHPGKAAPLLKTLGTGKRAPEEAILRVLRLDLEGLDLRVRRWLRETA